MLGCFSRIRTFSVTNLSLSGFDFFDFRDIFSFDGLFLPLSFMIEFYAHRFAIIKSIQG